MSNHLCQLATTWNSSLPEGGAMVERKWDGVRCLYFTGIDGVARLWTRNGMPIEGCDHIARRLARIEAAAGQSLFVDGELIVDGTLAATKRWIETEWRTGGERGLFYAFDVMPFREWQCGGSSMPQYERKALLRQLLNSSEPRDDGWTWPAGSRGAIAGEAIELVDDEWAFSGADVMDAANRVLADGGEGVVVKDPMAAYSRMRSATWSKIKLATLTEQGVRIMAV